MRRTTWGWIALALAACGCSDASILEACDIRQSSCQRDVFLAVQEVRGGVWDPWLEIPPMRVISSGRYRDELELSRELAAAGDGPHDYLTPALKLLHMIDPDEREDGMTDFSVSFVAAYYDASQRSVTIIDRGERTDHREDVRTLAHELVHAAQGRDIGFALINTWISSADTANAVGSLIEGEAMLYENLVDAKQRSLQPQNINWRSYHAGWIADTRARIVSNASPFRIASSGLRYPLGSQYLVSAYVEGAQLGVRQALSAHPVATAQLMAGRKSLWDHQPAAWSCGYPSAPPGYESVTAEELGSYSLYAFATRVLADDDALAWKLASAWNGDRFLIYADRDEQLGVVWLLRFRTAEDASRMHEALAQSPLDVSIESELRGEHLLLFAASPPLPDYAEWRSCHDMP